MLYFLLNFSEVDQETEEEEKTFLLYGDEIFPHLNAFASSSWPPLRVPVQGEQVTPCRSFDGESICFKYSVQALHFQAEGQSQLWSQGGKRGGSHIW